MENSKGDSAPPPEVEISGVGSGPVAAELTDMEYLNILQSIGQAVHVLDRNYCIIYWNRSAEKLYGFSCEEGLGEDVTELLGDRKDRSVAYNILDRVLKGENWTGQFPVLADSTPFKRANSFLSDFETDSGELGRVHQPRQGKFPSKLSYSPSAVSEPGMMPEEVNILLEGVHGYIGGARTPIGDTYLSPFGVFSRGRLEEASPSHQESYDMTEVKPRISRISSKAESWIGKAVTKFSWFGRMWSQNKRDHESAEYEVAETSRTANCEASGYCSSAVKINSKSHASTSSNTSSTAVIAVDKRPRSLNYDIMWEELTIGERIGQGSCGTVYRALWYGSICPLALLFNNAVAVKLFSRQEYSDDVIRSFKQEVSIMKRLRHPNILLFMGAVTSPERLCIVTEFLPRGSLFELLRKSAAKLEKRRLVHMALDIARGMNYLHC